MKTIVSRRCARLLILAAAFAASACAEPAATAPEWAWTGFRRPEGANPVIAPDTATRFFCPLRREWVAWQEGDTFNPAAAVHDGRVVLLYRAEDRSGEGIGQRTSRLGCAFSDDGVHFERLPEPVFYPDVDSQTALEWPGGVEDPRIVQTDEGLYVMFYTQWNRRQARLAVATSRDLLTWHKHGPAFAKAHGGRFRDAFSKSASPVTRVDGGRQTVARIGGRYWMYWGEQFVNVAVSDNLTDWTPLLGPDGDLYADKVKADQQALREEYARRLRERDLIPIAEARAARRGAARRILLQLTDRVRPAGGGDLCGLSAPLHRKHRRREARRRRVYPRVLLRRAGALRRGRSHAAERAARQALLRPRGRFRAQRAVSRRDGLHRGAGAARREVVPLLRLCRFARGRRRARGRGGTCGAAMIRQ